MQTIRDERDARKTRTLVILLSVIALFFGGAIVRHLLWP